MHENVKTRSTMICAEATLANTTKCERTDMRLSIIDTSRAKAGYNYNNLIHCSYNVRNSQ